MVISTKVIFLTLVSRIAQCICGSTPRDPRWSSAPLGDVQFLSRGRAMTRLCKAPRAPAWRWQMSLPSMSPWPKQNIQPSLILSWPRVGGETSLLPERTPKTGLGKVDWIFKIIIIYHIPSIFGGLNIYFQVFTENPRLFWFIFIKTELHFMSTMLYKLQCPKCSFWCFLSPVAPIRTLGGLLDVLRKSEQQLSR